MSDAGIPDAAAVQPRRSYRATTDPVENHTVLPSAEVEHNLVGLLTNPLPHRFVPSFIHEITHHRCFFTPVGGAAAWLHLRARRRAVDVRMANGIDTEPEEIDVLDDFIRYETVHEALRPLSEGLALFAENDVVPGSSPSVSDVMHLVARHCVAAATDSIYNDALPTYLAGLRRKHTSFGRKRHLLLQPMDTDADGYLPGYLMVKNTWLEAARREPRLADTDLFLQYMIASVFYDYGLVAQILDPGTSDAAAVTRIANHIGLRLSRVVTGDIGGRLDALERSRTTEDVPFERAAIEAIEHPNLDTDNELWAVGRERIARLDSLMAEEAASGRPSAALVGPHEWVLARRELITLGRAAVDLDVNEHNRLLVRGGGRAVLGREAAGLDIPATPARGTLTVYINPSPWARYTALALVADGRLILTQFDRPVDDGLKDHFRNYALQDRETQDTEFFARNLQDVLDADGTAQVLLEWARTTMSDWRRRTYGMRALLHVPEVHVPDVLRSMRDGLYPVLDVDAISALAWIGLNAPRRHADEVRTLFEADRHLHEYPGTLDEALDAINHRAEANFGSPLILTSAHMLLPLV